MSYKFSIIIPCYNSELYVEKAILSVINQSFCNFELILINDGSTDNTPQILQYYADLDKRIRLYSKSNGGGYCSAVNFGLNMVEGDYFLTLGSDDWLNVNLLEGLATLIEDKNPDAVAFKFFFHSHNINPELFSPDSFKSAFYYQGEFASFWKKHPSKAFLFANRDTGKVFKSSLLKDLRFFGRYGFVSDNVFSLLFSHRCNLFLVCPVDGYHCTLRHESLSARELSLSVHIDRIVVSYEFIKNAFKIRRESLCSLDNDRAVAGVKRISFLLFNKPSAIFQNLFLIKKYTFCLHAFIIVKRIWPLNFKKMIISFLPASFALVFLIKAIFKKPK